MKGWTVFGIALLLLLALLLIVAERWEGAGFIGEDGLLLSSGYYEPCDCDLSVKDRGIPRGIVRNRYTLYLLFDVKQDREHVYVAGMGRGEFYHIVRPVEVPAE